MKKNVLIIILCSVGALLIGFVIGHYSKWPATGSDLEGNIGKVSKYRKATASANLNVFEEKIKADSVFKNQTILSMTVINSQMSEFKQFLKQSIDASENIPELSMCNNKMKSLTDFANNAQASALAALNSLTDMTGDNETTNYEELSNNTLIAYMFLDNYKEISKTYIEEVDRYLSSKKVTDYRSLAFSRDCWASFNRMSSLMNNETNQQNNQKDFLLTPDMTKEMITSLDTLQQQVFINAAIINSLLTDIMLQKESTQKGNHTTDMSASRTATLAGYYANTLNAVLAKYNLDKECDLSVFKINEAYKLVYTDKAKDNLNILFGNTQKLDMIIILLAKDMFNLYGVRNTEELQQSLTQGLNVILAHEDLGHNDGASKIGLLKNEESLKNTLMQNVSVLSIQRMVGTVAL